MESIGLRERQKSIKVWLYLVSPLMLILGFVIITMIFQRPLTSFFTIVIFLLGVFIWWLMYEYIYKVYVKKWTVPNYFPCPYCDKSIEIYYDWQCDYCDKLQGEKRLVSERCTNCLRYLESIHCEHCDKEVGL